MKKKILTQEEFLEKLKQKNPIIYNRTEILEEYKGANINLKCKDKITQDIYYKSPAQLYRFKTGKIRKNIIPHNKLDIISFKEKFKEKNIHDLEVIGPYVSNGVPLYCKCKEKHIFKKSPNELMNGDNCPYCTGHAVLKNYNSFGIKFPELIKYFKNPSDAYNYTYQSNQKVQLKCPICGYEKEVILCNFAKRQIFSCDICGDGVSSFNKFIRKTIEYKKDLFSDFKFEYYPKWEGQKYKYDAYFIYQNKKYIVECQGIQHYTERWAGKKISCKENDRNKKELALRNGIDFYIELECKQNGFEYLYDSFNKTILKNIFVLTKEEFKKIFIDCQISYFEQSIKLYNEDNDISTICKELMISKTSVRTYLKRGEELGLCKLRKERTNGLEIKIYDYKNKEKYLFHNKKEVLDFLEKQGYKISLNTLAKYLELGGYKNFNFEVLN